MGVYVVTGSLLPLERIVSTSMWRRWMTCTDTRSLTRSGAAAGVCRSCHRTDVAAYDHGYLASANVFLAHKGDVGRLTIASAASTPQSNLGLDHSGLSGMTAER
jgi:hypothetical protein